MQADPILSQLTSIGGGAFSGCSSLASISLPDSLTSIGESAFSGCSSLTSINIPEKVTTISESAFSGCSSLTSLRIPKTVQKIGSGIIYNSGIQTIFCYLDEPLKGVDSQTFNIQFSSYLGPKVLYVPQGKLSVYVSAGWNKYFGKIVEMDAPDAKYPISLKIQGEGTIATTGFEDLTKVPHDTELSITATAKEGWELSQLTANGADITAAKKFVVTKATTVVATFVKQTFAVKTSVQGEGTIAITGFEDLTKVPYGTELSVTATAKEGWKLSRLTANGVDIIATKKFVVTKATEVIAEFADYTSIEGAQGASLKIYPNPAKDFVQIQGASAAAIVRLYGLDGRLVLIANADTDGAVRLNVSALAAGEYLLVIGSERRKLIIE